MGGNRPRITVSPTELWFTTCSDTKQTTALTISNEGDEMIALKAKTSDPNLCVDLPYFFIKGNDSVILQVSCWSPKKAAGHHTEYLSFMYALAFLNASDDPQIFWKNVVAWKEKTIDVHFKKTANEVPVVQSLKTGRESSAATPAQEGNVENSDMKAIRGSVPKLDETLGFNESPLVQQKADYVLPRKLSDLFRKLDAEEKARASKQTNKGGFFGYALWRRRRKGKCEPKLPATTRGKKESCHRTDRKLHTRSTVRKRDRAAPSNNTTSPSAADRSTGNWTKFFRWLFCRGSKTN
uniref:MSP domain-containing protein n=1 Tax=Trichuris muris TaxID=70415 RepID=A0A5S6QCA4_TRIMR